LAGKAVVPELMQSDFTAEKLAGAVESLLDHPEERRAMAQELLAVKARLGPGHAIERAAEAVLRLLDNRSSSAAVTGS